MEIRAIAFDINGTLIEIITDEGLDEIYRDIKHFLSYQGILVRKSYLRDTYFRLVKEQKNASPEKHAEFDAVAIWRKVVYDNLSDYTRGLPEERVKQLPILLAQMQRGISRKHLKLYPYVREVLNVLRTKYPLAIVTDAQTAFARAEMNKVGILGYFNPIVVSGDYGYRKPDKRLFTKVLEVLKVPAENTLYIGNDMYRDVHGAKKVGMKTVMFKSNQGEKTHKDTKPDFAIDDYRQLLPILGLPPLKG